MIKPTPLTYAHHQQGAVLIMGLVLLMALTIVGVASMSNNTLQSRMAGNLMDSNLAFNAAETAARAMLAGLNPDEGGSSSCSGETFDGTPASTAGARTCILDIGDSVNGRDDISWMENTDHTWWTTGGGANFVQTFTGDFTAKIGGYDLISSAPIAIVEIHKVSFASGDLTAENLGKPTTTYRITVRGTGASDNSQAVIQQLMNKHL